MPLAPVSAWWLLLPLALVASVLPRLGARPARPAWPGLAFGGALALAALAALALLAGGPMRLVVSLAGGLLGVGAACAGRAWGDRAGAAVALGAALAGAWALGADGQGVPFANAAIAGLTAWGALALAAAASGEPDDRAGLGAFAAVAAALGGAAWGGKLLAASALGPGAALGVGAIALAAGAWLPEGAAWLRRAGVAFAAALLAAFWLGAVYHLPLPLVGLGALGMAAGALAFGGAAPQAPQGPLGVLRGGLSVAGAGGLVVVAMRLGGSVGAGFLAAGAGLAAFGPGRAPALARWAVALGALRVWLQLFLDRTALTGYGVDLTHPYAFAALLAGAIALPMLRAAHRLGAPDFVLRWGGGLGAALVPAWLGFFWQIEAVAAFLVGGLLSALAASRDGDEAPFVALVLTQAGLALLAAPWLVHSLDWGRGPRLLVFLGGVLAGLAALGHWAFRVARRGRIPA